MLNKSKVYRHNLLSGSIAIALLNAGASMSAIAQEGEQQSQDIEVISVAGIRSSLTSAANIKRQSNGVVDVITAEDIGKFPDTNLAESLQRITGVSVDRSNNEGNQVSVRGFGPTFNMVTLNGRAMPTSSTLSTDGGVNRAFNFQHIASEVVSGVDVYKTGKAHVTGGGLGATINLHTAKPLTLGKQTISGSIKGIMDQSNVSGDDITPELSGLYSNVFADGKFGILVALSHSQRDSRKESVNNDGWLPDNGSTYSGIDASGITNPNNPNNTFWVPRNFAVEYGDHHRERNNQQIVVQYAATDNLTATLDYTGSQFDESINRVLTGFWFDSDENTTGTVDANGTVTNPRHKNHRLNFTNTHQLIETENKSFGLNLEWQATENLQLAFDAHDSTSETQPGGEISEFTTVISTPPDLRYVDIGLDFTGADVPSVIANPSTTTEAGVAPGPIAANYDPYSLQNIDGDVVVVRGNAVKNQIKQWELSGEWLNNNDSALSKISFGVGNTDYQYDTKTRFGFSVITNQLDLNTLGLSFTPAETGRGFSNAENLFPMQYNVDPIVVNQAITAGNLITENPVNIDLVNEKTFSAYFSMDFATEFNDLPININAGLRFEDTDVLASSTANLPDALVYLTVEEIRGVYPTDQNVTFDTLTGGYSEFLPNLDINIEFSDDIVGRFSYSRTIARSDITAIAPATRITNTRPGGPFLASQGDPNLLPYGSNNLDLSLEWYYDEGSYVSAGYFKKYVNNFIGTNVVQRTINSANGSPLTDPSANPRPGCPDPSSNPVNQACVSQASDPEIIFDVTVPSNLEDAEIDGWEFAIQHMFGESGFGSIFNFTLVDGSVEYDIYSFEQTVALTGLSDSANLVAFYDKDGFQARLAYNWRDEFLLRTNQFQSSNEPIFTEAYGQLDMSVSYAINENITVVLDGVNLLEETAHRHGRFENQFLAAEDFGSRYSIGVRATF